MKKVNKVQEIFGSELKLSEKNELLLILDLVNDLESKTNLVFSDVYNKAKALRTNPKFDLLPFANLSKGSARNFKNRIARVLLNTKFTAKNNPSLQSKYFNIETQTNLKVQFSSPIDYTKKLLSPQITRDQISFNIVGKSELNQRNFKDSKTFLKGFANWKTKQGINA